MPVGIYNPPMENHYEDVHLSRPTGYTCTRIASTIRVCERYLQWKLKLIQPVIDLFDDATVNETAFHECSHGSSVEVRFECFQNLTVLQVLKSFCLLRHLKPCDLCCTIMDMDTLYYRDTGYGCF